MGNNVKWERTMDEQQYPEEGFEYEIEQLLFGLLIRPERENEQRFILSFDDIKVIARANLSDVLQATPLADGTPRDIKTFDPVVYHGKGPILGQRAARVLSGHGFVLLDPFSGYTPYRRTKSKVRFAVHKERHEDWNAYADKRMKASGADERRYLDLHHAILLDCNDEVYKFQQGGFSFGSGMGYLENIKQEDERLQRMAYVGNEQQGTVLDKSKFKRVTTPQASVLGGDFDA